MTALTLNNPGPALAAAPARRSPTAGVTFGRIVASEWIKFRSVRSTLWTLPVTALVMVGLAVLQAWGAVTVGGDALEVGGSAPTIVTGGWFLAQLVVAVLAILTITGEYSTGQIRSSVTAVPRRVPILAAKALVLFVAVAVVSTAAVALSWLASLPFLNQLGVTVDLSDPDQLRVLLGTPLYLATIALFAFAVGALLRHSAGALAIVLGLLLVLENVFALLPFRFFEVVSPFLPSTSGGRILLDSETLQFMDADSTGAHLTAWQGYGVLVAWVAVLLTAAAVLLRRRDA